MTSLRTKSRYGTSMMEVIVGLTLVTMLLVPMVGIMSASARIWRQFESGHGSTAQRHATLQDIGARLRSASRSLNVAGNQIRFQTSAGDTQRLYQRGNQVFWQHAGQTDLIADGVGTLQFRQISRGGNPSLGELVEVQLQNTAGSAVANASSRYFVWIKPSI